MARRLPDHRGGAREENGWDEIIATDDPERGGKLATFVLRMLGDTALVADSIGTYVWALRWKMKLAHQADPVLGVMHWQDFMRSVRVKAHVPHEPLRAVPLRARRRGRERRREPAQEASQGRQSLTRALI